MTDLSSPTRSGGADRPPRALAWPAVAITALASLAVAACSDVPPAQGEIDAGPDPRTFILETDTGGLDARAGLTFHVDCRTFLAGPLDADGTPTLGDEMLLPGAATVVVVDGPAGPLAVTGTDLVFSRAGDYHVACQIAEFELVDATPALLPVVAGLPVSIETTVLGPLGTPASALPISQLAAGTATAIGCEGSDKFANPIIVGWQVVVAPDMGNDPKSLVIQFNKTGKYDIACHVDGTVDSSPAELTIVPGVPRHLWTLLEPKTIVAGHAAKLACVALDDWDNPIVDFPFSIDHSDALSLQGLYVSATKAGLHNIQCVPETLKWDLFVLHTGTLQVLPGPASELLVGSIPAKAVYKRKEKVQFVVTVRDDYGNIIPDVATTLAVTEPAKGYKVTSETTIQFNLDATYNVHFEVVGVPTVAVDLAILVDGAPPLLTIEEPPWGSTLDGKPSVKLVGKAGDAGAGVKSLKVNGKLAFPDALDTWYAQHGAQHGLNLIHAVAEDLGGEVSEAIRGFYYASKYYPTDASTPKGALVKHGMQLFVGKDLIDDGVHDTLPQPVHDAPGRAMCRKEAGDNDVGVENGKRFSHGPAPCRLGPPQ